MFLRSVQLGNFLNRSLGALKHLYRTTFYAIDELWILQKLNNFDPSLADVPPVGAAWQFFKSFPGCIEASVPENFLCNRRTLNFAKIKKVRPVCSEYSSGR